MGEYAVTLLSGRVETGYTGTRGSSLVCLVSWMDRLVPVGATYVVVYGNRARILRVWRGR